MDWSRSDLVGPFGRIQNRFLEVLVSHFVLRRKKDGGSELSVHFTENTPAIWTKGGKDAVQRMIPDFERKSRAYQEQLDNFLLQNEGEFYEFYDPDFPFRYASGGTLPILKLGEQEYYCLFYRDIEPIGWNIANGGCDTQNELLNPIDTVERELREELLIVEPARRKRYVFEYTTGKQIDRPEFELARKFWQELYPSLNVSDFDELDIPLKWINGPDSLKVRLGESSGESPRDGFFLNINAEDFGIEVDKIARISLEKDVTLLDGEVSGDILINRLIGLFKVDTFNRKIEGGTEFFPDRFFYGGIPYDNKEDIAPVIKRYLHALVKGKRRTNEDMFVYDAKETKFDLCPITRRILMRYLALNMQRPEAAIKTGDFDVLISFGIEDKDLAGKVFNHLREKKIRVFFSEETMIHPDFMRVIEKALESANCFVAVATKPEHMNKSWPQFEARVFYYDILYGRKPKGKMVSFINGFNPVELPLPLRLYHAVECDLTNLEPGFKELDKFVL